MSKLEIARKVSWLGWVGVVLIPFVLVAGLALVMGGSAAPFLLLGAASGYCSMVGIAANEVVRSEVKRINAS